MRLVNFKDPHSGAEIWINCDNIVVIQSIIVNKKTRTKVVAQNPLIPNLEPTEEMTSIIFVGGLQIFVAGTAADNAKRIYR